MLYAGVVGNVYTWYAQYFTSDDYKKQMAIYTSTQQALHTARTHKLPILITPHITYPYEQATLDAGLPDPAVWVLKTFPGYDVTRPLPVYAIKDMTSKNQLPTGVDSAIASDGWSFTMVTKK